MNLPNWITLSRLLAIPFLLYWLHGSPSPHDRWLAFGLFALAAGTDWLDGYLARKLNAITELGKFLDPLTDKLLVLAPLVAAVELGWVPAWGVFLILGRELAIAGWRVNQVTVTGANIWGKLKTVVQMLAILALLAPLAEPMPTIAIALFWVAVALTLISGLLYGLPQLQVGSARRSGID